MRCHFTWAFAVFAIGEAARGVTTGPLQPTRAAYPPSCLSAPLTDLPSGPNVSRRTRLARLDRATSEYRGFEAVDFTFWRVACEGGRSALLLRIARTDPNSATSAQFPFTYGLVARQDEVTGAVRLAQEPNTQTSSVQPGALIDSAVTLVLENISQEDAFGEVRMPAMLPPGVRAAVFNFNKAIDITIPDPASSGINPLPPPLVVSIPAYDANQYVGGFAPMAITGYNVGNYFDPAHSGEGIIIEVGDATSPSVPRQRYVSVAWFTYDQTGKPFWLYGVGNFTAGASTVEVPLAYFTDGGFAGAFTALPRSSSWGSITLSFPDCTSMHFSYASSAGLPPPLPAGSGDRIWTRLTQENGLVCN